VNTSSLEAQHAGLEECFGAPEPLVADGDDLSIRKFVTLLEAGALSRKLNLVLEVESDVAELLLDISHHLAFSGSVERVSALGENLDQVIGQVTASEVESLDRMREREAFIDGHSVGDTIAGVQNDTSGTTRGVEGEDCLDGDVERGGIERLEHDLSHLLPVGLGIERSFGEKNWMFLRSDAKLVVEGVMPDLLHVIPVGNDAMFDGILEGEDASLGLGFVTGSWVSNRRASWEESSVPNIGVLAGHTDHDALVALLGSANDRSNTS
jgi:hypothetical protein